MSCHSHKICASLHHGTLFLETFKDLQCIKSVLTGALFVRFCRSYNFSDLSFWLKMHFVHSILVLTSAVSVVLLWPSEEDKVTSLNLRFCEFVDITYHFNIIFSFKYTVWKNLRIFLYFNKEVVFISADIFMCWCFEITLVIILFNKIIS